MRFIYLLLIFLVGCIPENIYYTIEPSTENKIVVNARLLPFGGVVVALSEAFTGVQNPEDINDFLLEDSVLITIHQNGNVDTLSKTSTGIYTNLNVLYNENTTYKLNIDFIKDKKNVYSVVQSLPIVKIDSIYHYSYSTEEFDFFVDFRDEINSDNFYLLNIYHASDFKFLNSEFSLLFLFNNNALFSSIYKDSDFDSKQIKLKVNKINITNNNSDFDTLIFSLSNIDKKYYDYLTTKINSDFISNLTGQPQNPITNITNGYGFFNTHIPEVKYLILDKRY